MKKILVLAMVLGLLVISGCAAIPISHDQLENIDCGPYPENYEQIVKSYFEMKLFDPFSVQYKFDQPYKGYTRKAPIVGGGLDEFGYILTIWVNAKNRMGGYVGWKRRILLIRNGEVITEIFPNPYFGEGWYRD